LQLVFQIHFLPLSLLSSGTLIMQMLFYLMLLQRSFFFFSLLIHTSTSSSLLLNTSSACFCSVIVFFSFVTCLILYVFSLLQFSLTSSIHHLSSVENLYDHYFEFFIRYTIYHFSLRSFSEVFVLLFCLEYSYLFPHFT